MTIDPRTPVVVGVGQAAERVGDADYRGMSAVDLATAAAQAALQTARPPTLARSPRPSISWRAPVSLRSRAATTRSAGKVDELSALGGQQGRRRPAHAVLDVIGGQGPQRLLDEFPPPSPRVTSGTRSIFGSDNMSTLRHLADADPKPDFTEARRGTTRGSRIRVGRHHRRLPHRPRHDVAGCPVRRHGERTTRPLRHENARISMPDGRIARALHQGRRQESVRRFTRRAFGGRARHRRHEEPADLYPVPEVVVARDLVNQGAAALVMAVGAAHRLGVPQEKWVYLCGHADMTEQPLLARPDLGRSHTAEMAAHEALSVAGVTADEIATFDLYSCFPISVFDMCDHLGIAPDDPRGLTLTGGLPYFGGAGNNYSMHGIAETICQMRVGPAISASLAPPVALCPSARLACTPPHHSHGGATAAANAERGQSWPTVAVTRVADGDATIETYTVHYDWPTTTGVVIGRLRSDSSRFMATREDEDLVTLLAEGEPLGAKVLVQASEYGNHVSLK